MIWPFKRKVKALPPAPVQSMYVCASRGGVVSEVQTGYVRIGRTEYRGMKATLVVPGQEVAKDQPVGKM